ncbi:MAG: T9SS type A sorting domain-containing protein [Candidatus Edwardsbacteria bacterium]|nr:T9SS type A sorting domain-containing protein [Candidatus Edwardsbacteria bacterium]
MKCLSVLLLLSAIAAGAAAQPIALTVDDDPQPAPAWGANVTVTGQSVYAFDVDYRDNGEIYLAIVCPAGARDTFKVLRSSNGGASWSPFLLYLANGGRKFTDIALVCGGESLLVFVPQDTARGPSRDYAARFGYSGGVAWFNFTDTMHAPLGTIIEVDADCNADGDTMMIAYTADSVGINTGTAIRRSTNGGASWLWRISDRSARDVSIAWIQDHRWAMAYKCYWTDPYYYKHTFVSVSSDDGLNFQDARVDSTARDTMNIDPSITACRSTGRAVVATTQIDLATSGDIDVYRARDAGDTTYQLVLDYAPGDDQLLPTVNCSRFDAGGWVDLAYADDYGDCIGRLASQYGDSGSWGTAQIVSDRPASVSVAPAIAYWNDGVHNGPAVFYAGTGGNGIFMNAEWVSGVAGGPDVPIPATPAVLLAPNPARDEARLSFTLAAPGPVRAALYDIAGRRVRTLTNRVCQAGSCRVPVNTIGLATGVYFLRVEAPGLDVVRKLSVIR